MCWGIRWPDRTRAAGYDNSGGENIAKGHATPAAAFWAWFDSPGHHRNLIADGPLVGELPLADPVFDPRQAQQHLPAGMREPAGPQAIIDPSAPSPPKECCLDSNLGRPNVMCHNDSLRQRSRMANEPILPRNKRSASLQATDA